MSARNILLICGTLSQTKAMMAIGDELADHNSSYIEPESLRQALPCQNGGTSARNIARVCRACFDSNPVDVEQARGQAEAGVVHLPSSTDLRLLPQAGEWSLAYPHAQGLRQALRRGPSQSRIENVNLETW
jgi:hypothetical protein